MINFDLPYSSKRSPVCADNIVATSQPLATQAGIHVLRKGGNAVDAALAASMVLTVVEPCATGVGSDTFAIVSKDDRIYAINASGRSPKGWLPDRFSGMEEMPRFGWDTVTVPGTVSAWVELSEKFGRLSFEELFDDAIRYASDGFQVAPITAKVWRDAAPLYEEYPEFCKHFLPSPEPGAKFFRPDLADSLEEIAKTKGASFYSGKIAERIIEASDIGGGVMTLEDLQGHTTEWVRPLKQRFQDVEIHEIPPNAQGLATLIALGILQYFDLDLDTAESTHLQIEAMKIAIKAAFDHIGDIDSMKVMPDQLLDKTNLERAARKISKKASPIPPVALPVSHDTVYLCAADKEGLMVSYIQSCYKNFGSGIVIPGTGIAMQCRGQGFSLQPGHPNQVGPKKRPYHTIIPGFATRDGRSIMAFGVMGGHMQHQGHLQMVTRVFCHKQNPQAASDAPRWLINPDYTISVETTMPPEILKDLAYRGHDISYDEETGRFGGAQLILRTRDGYVAGSDHRKDGNAAGF